MPGAGRSTSSPSNCANRSKRRSIYRTPLKKLTLISSEKGGATLRWFVEGAPGSTWQSGEYYDERTPTTTMNPQALDDFIVDGLWQRSAALVGIAGRAEIARSSLHHRGSGALAPVDSGDEAEIEVPRSMARFAQHAFKQLVAA